MLIVLRTLYWTAAEFCCMSRQSMLRDKGCILLALLHPLTHCIKSIDLLYIIFTTLPNRTHFKTFCRRRRRRHCVFFYQPFHNTAPFWTCAVEKRGRTRFINSECCCCCCCCAYAAVWGYEMIGFSLPRGIGNSPAAKHWQVYSILGCSPQSSIFAEGFLLRSRCNGEQWEIVCEYVLNIIERSLLERSQRSLSVGFIIIKYIKLKMEGLIIDIILHNRISILEWQH